MKKQVDLAFHFLVLALFLSSGGATTVPEL
jgi:uncharacterized protein (UPF0333 family)